VDVVAKAENVQVKSSRVKVRRMEWVQNREKRWNPEAEVINKHVDQIAHFQCFFKIFSPFDRLQ